MSAARLASAGTDAVPRLPFTEIRGDTARRLGSNSTAMPTDAALQNPPSARSLDQAKRVRTAVHGTIGPMLFLGMVYLLLGRTHSAFVLAVSSLLLSLSYRLLRQGRTDAAADWLLVVATVSVAALAMVGHGLRDVSLLIWPTVLVAAGLFRTQRVLMGLLGLQGVLLVGLAWAYARPAHLIVASQPVLALTLMPILGVTAYAVWHLTHDLRESLAQAQASMAALQASLRRDALTGLPNRRAAEEALAPAFAQASPEPHSVAMLNLDGFRAINDAFGPQVADRLLVALSERWAAMLGPDELLCRLSGDEFLLIRRGRQEDAERLAWVHRWVVATRPALDLQGLEMRCTLSAGVTGTHSATRYAELLSQLDAAVRLARHRGRNGVAAFSPALQDDHARQQALLLAMRDSLHHRRDFSLVYQPKINLATGRLVGAEALLRWVHPTHGRISPAEFIPLAESSGLVVELGHWALQEACRQAQAWRQAGWSAFHVAVNVSVVQCQREDLVHDVERSLAESGLPGSALVLELTESVLAQASPHLHDTLGGLRALGVTLAIDDFGTGYSNLGYLSQMEVQQIKIDQGFVHRLSHSAADRAIVEAIAGVGNKLGLGLVAEGIEHADQARDLQALGCHTGQGLLWSEPLPAEALWARFQADGSANSAPAPHAAAAAGVVG